MPPPAHTHPNSRQWDTRRRRQRQRETLPRPPPHWFTLGSLRTLSRRLVRPPPPVEGEKYFMLAPMYDVKLEDVVGDKHLPPLSLQEFEDYLQHVEGTPENLYFYLWLRRYSRVHHDWATSVLPAANIPSSSKYAHRSRDLWERLYPCQDRQLRDEFAFAKAQFFEDDGPMRLAIDDALRQKVLVIAHVPPQDQVLTDKLPSFPSQPEPGHFDAVRVQVEAQLEGAFRRFVKLAFCNSGLWHSCLGHVLGAAILAAGLVLWTMGVGRVGGSGRGHVAGSLPLIWVGVWFMLVSVHGHCLGVYSTGDARQLYPYELVRPVSSDVVPPPVYSIARPEESPPGYAPSRKASGASSLPTFVIPTYPVKSYQRRKSEGVLGIAREERRESAELKLPPARKTKDIPRRSFGIDALPVTRAEAWVRLEAGQYQITFDDRPDSPGFTEENDFGIVVSEAYEEDEPYGAVPGAIDAEPVPTMLAPLAPLVDGPEYAAQRRMTLPDIFAPDELSSGRQRSIALDWVLKEASGRRGSRDEERTVWPWPRALLGPMTPVQSPLVRRAHWVLTVRTAAVALAVTCGMMFGLVR